MDVSVLTIRGAIISTISTNGDMHLGGADFDKAVLNYCIKMINENRQFDWNSKRGKRAKLRLLEACREAKQ